MRFGHGRPLSEVGYIVSDRVNGERILIAKWVASNGHPVRTELKFKGQGAITSQHYEEVEDVLTELVMACELDIARGCFSDWTDGHSAQSGLQDYVWRDEEAA